MLVWLASISPLTLCADCAYGDFLDKATCNTDTIKGCAYGDFLDSATCNTSTIKEPKVTAV